MNYIETCTKIAVFLWRSSNYRPLKSVLHVRPGWISKYAGDLREKSHEVWTWNSNRSRCTSKKMTGGGWKSPPPPNGIRVKYLPNYLWQVKVRFGQVLWKPRENSCLNLLGKQTSFSRIIPIISTQLPFNTFSFNIVYIFFGQGKASFGQAFIWYSLHFTCTPTNKWCMNDGVHLPKWASGHNVIFPFKIKMKVYSTLYRQMI